MRRIEQPRQKLLVVAAVICAAAAMWLLHIPCPFRALLGVDCPGCGMTHAVMAALRLDFAAALRGHWMVWSLPLCALLFLYDGRLFRRTWANGVVWGLIAAGYGANWLLNGSNFAGFC